MLNITTPLHTPLSLENHCHLPPSLTHHHAMSSSPTVNTVHHHHLHHTSITRVLVSSVHLHLHHHHSSLTLITTLLILMHQSVLLHPLSTPTVIHFRHTTSSRNLYLAQVNIYSHIQSHICNLLNLLFSNRLFSFDRGHHTRRSSISIFNSYR